LACLTLSCKKDFNPFRLVESGFFFLFFVRQEIIKPMWAILHCLCYLWALAGGYPNEANFPTLFFEYFDFLKFYPGT